MRSIRFHLADLGLPLSHKTVISIVFALYFVFCVPAVASPPKHDPVPIVRALLATPDDRIDFLTAKLTIDKLINPSIDVAAWRGQIDRMVAVVKAMAGPDAGTIQRLAAVRRFLSVDGDWNGHRPFHYDFADPFGALHKRLPVYLTTRLGNCVSMPILFLILADRMGVHVTLSTAPRHMFVKFIDNTTGKAYNLEATNGGLPERDAWIRQQAPITDDAIRNGLYLRTLTRRESVAVMAILLLEQYETTGQEQNLIGVAQLIQQVYPNNAEAMLAEGTAYARLIQSRFRAKYPTPADIPAKLRPVYLSYAQKNAQLFDRALALGWRDTEHPVQTTSY